MGKLGWQIQRIKNEENLRIRVPFRISLVKYSTKLSSVEEILFRRNIYSDRKVTLPFIGCSSKKFSKFFIYEDVRGKRNREAHPIIITITIVIAMVMLIIITIIILITIILITIINPPLRHQAKQDNTVERCSCRSFSSRLVRVSSYESLSEVFILV